MLELKLLVEGILKRPPDEQVLTRNNQPLEDTKTLAECGLTSQVAKPQAPATVGLAFRTEDGLDGPSIYPCPFPSELSEEELWEEC